MDSFGTLKKLICRFCRYCRYRQNWQYRQIIFRIVYFCLSPHKENFFYIISFGKDTRLVGCGWADSSPWEHAHKGLHSRSYTKGVKPVSFTKVIFYIFFMRGLSWFLSNINSNIRTFGTKRNSRLEFTFQFSSRIHVPIFVSNSRFNLRLEFTFPFALIHVLKNSNSQIH